MAQTYIITQNAGYCSLVTALFWSKEQTLADFVRGLTGPEEFPAKSEFMGSFFEKYQIPAEDRPLLITMLSKTGKAVWYGSDQTRPAMYMYYQCILPEYQLAVWPAETQSK
jgi:hypothetical protein